MARPGSASPAPASPPAGGIVAPPGTVLKGGGPTVSRGDVLISRQRTPLTIDPFSQAGQALAPALIAARTEAVANLFLGMQQVNDNLTQLQATVAVPTAPGQLIGVLLEPDGSAASLVQIQFDPSSLGSSSPKVTVQTDYSGSFHLPLPPGLPLALGGSLDLMVHGATANATVQVKNDQIAANGLVGALVLPQYVAPLPVSILAALQALVPPLPGSSPPPAPTNPPQLPIIKIGDDPDCLLAYGINSSEDRFPYGVFFRLVEPRASIVSMAQYHIVEGGNITLLPFYGGMYNPIKIGPTEPADPSNLGLPASVPPTAAGALPLVPPAGPGEGQVTYVDRVPVEQPISVDGFRDQMMGLQLDGTYTADETRPMAGTLGLGYVLWLSQRWTFEGLALGNLVYSLPLAPGEQQQVAIFERVDTARVTESEFFTEEQVLQQAATADTSTQATFNSAFREAVHGSSAYHTDASSDSWGVSTIIASGGGGSASSSGTSSQSLEGQRNTTQQTAQNTHSAAESQAAARRTAARTGMRIATASESASVTTKVITNHNHTRALTMQYWEVQRLYDVRTAIDGLTLTVLVPLQVVRFMPEGQPATLSDPSLMSTRSRVLDRYRAVVKHGDVLAQALPRRFQRGLTTLLQFAADPTAGVEPFGSAAEDVILFQLGGSFLPCEDIYVTAVTDRGTRVGPVQLAPPNSAPQIPVDTFATRAQLLEWLHGQRQGTSPLLYTGALALPPSMTRANIVGFEISRRFRQVAYTLISPAMAELNALQSLFGASNTWQTQAIQSILAPGTTARQTVFLSPADLGSALGGPQLNTFMAAVEEFDASGTALPSAQEQYANESLVGVELPPQPYPVPARQLAPVLRYNEILEIERMAAHVVRNTLTFSRAVWASMTPDERAILLEAYTIGVPPGGVTDATQMVPLLNCVENRVLGYFGNSMILPFFIPQALAEQGLRQGSQLDPAKIQEALLAYQTGTFRPPHSIIGLPTRGVLGEAVLGHCASAEKIDLTRFWNWQDSPADTAPAISPTALPTTTPSLAGGLTAPGSLTNLPSLINNVLTAPAPDTGLLQALSKAAASQQDFSTSLTGAQQLADLLTNAQNNANTARADALKTAGEQHQLAMAIAGNIVGGIYGGNPTAGSSAAAALSGKDAGSGAAPAAGGAKTGGAGKGGGAGAGDGGAAGGTGGTGGGTGGTGGGTGGTGGGTAGGATPAPGPPPQLPNPGDEPPA
jgi:hypothetical protein